MQGKQLVQRTWLWTSQEGLLRSIASLIHCTEHPLMVCTFAVILELTFHFSFIWKEFGLRALRPRCKANHSILSRDDQEMLSRLYAQWLSQGLLSQICSTLQAEPFSPPGEGLGFAWWVISLSRCPEINLTVCTFSNLENNVARLETYQRWQCKLLIICGLWCCSPLKKKKRKGDLGVQNFTWLRLVLGWLQL